MMNITDLIDELNKNFTQNRSYLFPLIINYTGTDWLKYKKDCATGYSRTKIYSNSNFDLFLINWSKHSKSKIHDHSKEGCVFKVLDGELCEKIYQPNTLKQTQTKSFKRNDISYINDNIGYHSIENNTNNNAYSLHIYIPSNHTTKYFN